MLTRFDVKSYNDEKLAQSKAKNKEKQIIKKEKTEDEGSSWFSVLVVIGVVAIGAIAYAKHTKKI